MKAVILAGGFGNRLKPFTDTLPKPLLPVAGKSTLEWILDLLCKYKFKKAILTLYYKGEMIINHFGGNYRGIRLIYITEKEPLGTAGAFNLVLDELDNTFFHIHGDILTDINIPKMYELHKSEEAYGTIGLTVVKDPSPFSSVVLDKNRILEYIFKPEKGKAPSNLVNSGCSILEPEALSLIKDKNVCDIDHDIFKPLVSMGKMYGYTHKGLWDTIDTVERYKNANRYWKISRR